MLKGLEKAKLFIGNREGKHREGSREGACLNSTENKEQHYHGCSLLLARLVSDCSLVATRMFLYKYQCVHTSKY